MAAASRGYSEITHLLANRKGLLALDHLSRVGDRVDVDVALVGAGGSVIRRVAIDGPRTPFALDAPFDIERVELDPQFTILHWTPAYRAEAEALVDVTRASAKRLAGDTAAAAALYVAGLARVPQDDRHGEHGAP